MVDKRYLDKLDIQAKIRKFLNEQPDADVSEVSNKTGIHVNTATKYMKEMGLTVTTAKKKQISGTRSKIVELRKEDPEITIPQIAKKIGIPINDTRKHLIALDLPTTTSRSITHSQIKHSQDTKDKIVEIRNKNPDISAAEIARILNVSDSLVRNYLKKAGLPTSTQYTQKTNRRIDDIKDKIVNMRLLEPSITTAEMARRLGANPANIRTHLLSLGLPTTTRDTLKYSTLHSVALPRMVLQIREENPDITSYEIADKLNISQPYARVLLLSLGLESITDRTSHFGQSHGNISDKIHQLIEENPNIKVHEIAQQLDISEATVRYYKSNYTDSTVEFTTDESIEFIDNDKNIEEKIVPGQMPGQTLLLGMSVAEPDVENLQINKESDYDQRMKEWKEKHGVTDIKPKRTRKKNKTESNDDFSTGRLFKAVPPRPELPQIKLSKGKKRNKDLIHSWFKKHKPPKHP